MSNESFLIFEIVSPVLDQIDYESSVITSIVEDVERGVVVITGETLIIP